MTRRSVQRPHTSRWTTETAAAAGQKGGLARAANRRQHQPPPTPTSFTPESQPEHHAGAPVPRHKSDDIATGAPSDATVSTSANGADARSASGRSADE
jgi:hypothetical protein